MPKMGEQTVKFEKNIYVKSTSSVVGPKEGEGPLAGSFDIVLDDIMVGEKSWEKAESKILSSSLDMAIKKANLKIEDIDYILSGDLLNQSTGSVFAIRDIPRPYIGIFAACSAMGLGMGIGSMFLESGFGKNIMVGVCSHFSAAEKQFRFPLDLGSQRPPTSSTTVTGAASVIISDTGANSDPKIRTATTGKMIDMGISDPTNMGAAMAPAAVDTLVTHFKDLNIQPDYYDCIATGDLGYIGHEIVVNLMEKQGYEMGNRYVDCGIMIFDKDKQDTHNGGSGPACSGVTFAGSLYKKLLTGQIKKLLFVPTGALMSPLSVQQKENIPGIAHAVSIEI